jgi:hypothetical protein
MSIMEMTRKQLQEVPLREWNKETVCECIVLLPQRRLHESGFRIIEVVCVTKAEPICRVAGCTDVLNLGGIGGREGNNLREVCVDCLRKSGCFTIWFEGKEMRVGASLSNLQIFPK